MIRNSILDLDVNIDSISRKKHPTIEETRTLSDALGIMNEQRVGSLPVCRGEELVGIFTERDYLRRFAGLNKNESDPIVKYMTPNPSVVRPGDTIGSLIDKISDEKLRHYPVVNDANEVVGLVSVRDVLRYLAEHFPDEILNQPPRSDHFSDTVEGG